MRSILLLPLVARCIETIDVCIWRLFDPRCSDCVWVCRHVCCVVGVVKDSVFSLGVMKYVLCLCKGCDGCCVFCLSCEAWICKCACFGGMIVSSCRCCMFVT